MANFQIWSIKIVRKRPGTIKKQKTHPNVVCINRRWSRFTILKFWGGKISWASENLDFVLGMVQSTALFPPFVDNVHQVMQAHTGLFVDCNAVFRLRISWRFTVVNRIVSRQTLWDTTCHAIAGTTARSLGRRRSIEAYRWHRAVFARKTRLSN